MLDTKRIAYLSFLGAALLFLIPPIFFLGINSYEEFFAISFQFLTAWVALGIFLFFQSNFYTKYRNWWTVMGLSLILLGMLAGIKVILTLIILSSFPVIYPQAPIPIIPESILHNTILCTLSLVYVHQYFQRKKNEENRLQIVQLQNENLQLQLNSLQQQLNPHFFFNSLNTLSELIYIDVEKSEAYISELSQVFRYILDMQRNPLVNLNKELKFIKSYFFLLKIRYDNKINLDCRIEHADLYKIPSLSLLVLFENVIKHNAINAEKPMTISMEIEGTNIVVRNNKNSLELKQHSFGIGLKNLSNRCMLLTDRNCIIEDKEHFFTVKTPLVKDENYNN